MSEQPKEPSQWAKDAAQACMQLAKWPPEHDIREWMAPIQSAIDAATAQRDAEIERLREELEAKNRIIARSDSEIDRLMDRKERIAQLEALLESQRHNHNEISYYGRLANIESAKKLCLACQYEALKKEQP